MGAALLGICALLACCGINFYAIGCNEKCRYDERLTGVQLDSSMRYIKLSACFGFTALAMMMGMHGLSGYWWTLFIVLPGLFGFCVAARVKDPTDTGFQTVEQAWEEADRRVEHARSSSRAPCLKRRADPACAPGQASMRVHGRIS